MVPVPDWVNLPQRKSPRAKGHDYSQPGAYFLTVCVEDRIPLLGKIIEGKMHLNGIGRMLQQTLLESNGRYPGIGLDVHCIMEDHFHLIAWLRWSPEGLIQTSIPQYMNRLKTMAMTRYKAIRASYPRLPEKFLQRSYWDRYIRYEHELERIRYYIMHNPLALQLKRDGAHFG
jgi:putative transposase